MELAIVFGCGFAVGLSTGFLIVLLGMMRKGVKP